MYVAMAISCSIQTDARSREVPSWVIFPLGCITTMSAKQSRSARIEDTGVQPSEILHLICKEGIMAGQLRDHRRNLISQSSLCLGELTTRYENEVLRHWRQNLTTCRQCLISRETENWTTTYDLNCGL